MTDEKLEALIKALWIRERPSVAAQTIRGQISMAVSDVEDYLPDYVWYLIDIAAQRGIDIGSPLK